MASCRSYGKDKKKHKTLESAQKHLDEANKYDSHLRQIYTCPECGFLHIGRTQTLKTLLWREMKLREKRENELVGILIGVLRGTYPRKERQAKKVRGAK